MSAARDAFRACLESFSDSDFPAYDGFEDRTSEGKESWKLAMNLRGAGQEKLVVEVGGDNGGSALFFELKEAAVTQVSEHLAKSIIAGNAGLVPAKTYYCKQDDEVGHAVNLHFGNRKAETLASRELLVATLYWLWSQQIVFREMFLGRDRALPDSVRQQLLDALQEQADTVKGIELWPGQDGGLGVARIRDLVESMSPVPGLGEATVNDKTGMVNLSALNSKQEPHWGFFFHAVDYCPHALRIVVSDLVDEKLVASGDPNFALHIGSWEATAPYGGVAWFPGDNVLLHFDLLFSPDERGEPEVSVLEEVVRGMLRAVYGIHLSAFQMTLKQLPPMLDPKAVFDAELKAYKELLGEA